MLGEADADLAGRVSGNIEGKAEKMVDCAAKGSIDEGAEICFEGGFNGGLCL